MSSDSQFTALGPTEIAFQTDGANIRIGAEISGQEVGVRGHCDTQFGLEGIGGGGGVHGVGISLPHDPESFVGPTSVGVLGESKDDNGIRGNSVNNDGVAGLTSSLGRSGVFGLNTHKNDPAGSVEFPRPAQIGFGVFGRCDLVNGAGVGGRSEGTDPVTGSGGVGVMGTSQAGDGVVGITDAVGKSGVFGFNSNKEEIAFGVFGRCDSTQGAGVSGRNDSGGDAVSGFSPKGVAVRGTSQENDGVVGHSEIVGKSGVFGENTSNPNPNIVVPGLPNEVFGVTGRANAVVGVGVLGDSANGTGVSGTGGIYGAKFQGGHAPMRLIPANSSGAPVNGFHLRGELFVDSEGNLFFCKADGTPGTWAKLA